MHTVMKVDGALCIFRYSLQWNNISDQIGLQHRQIKLKSSSQKALNLGCCWRLQRGAFVEAIIVKRLTAMAWMNHADHVPHAVCAANFCTDGRNWPAGQTAADPQGLAGVV
jgi:hypothetical protein